MNWRLKLLIGNLICIICLACSQDNTQQTQMAQHTLPGNPSPEYNLQQLEAALDKLSQNTILTHGDLAFSLRKAQSGEVLLEKQAEKTMVFASCIKAITTATALDILGADYKFETKLEYSGNIENGTLKGDVFIRGNGDPSLASNIIKSENLQTILNKWITAIKNKGIQKIEGNIIADEDAYVTDINPEEWIWGDMGNYFGAPAGALNVLDNTYKLWFRPGKLGDSAPILRTEPSIPNMQFVNDVKTAKVGSGDQVVISGAPYDLARYAMGTVPVGGLFSVKGSIPDPGLYLAQALRGKLDASGVQVMAKSTSTRILKLAGESYSSKRNLIYQQKSPSLKTIVNYTNRYSVNLFAEALLKAIAKKTKNEASNRAGIEAIVEYWEKQGLDTEGFYLKDGSGLARANGLTTNQLSEIFHLITKQNYFDDFYSSLPVAGVSGTMYSVGGGTALQNNLRAKSGGMSRVLAYVGYFKTKSGELMSFAIVVNNYTCKYQEIKKNLVDVMLTMVSI